MVARRASLVGAIVILSGCGLIRGPADASVGPGSTSTPSSVIKPSGTSVASAQLLSASVGWALSDGVPETLLWTETGGATWSDVTPPAVKAGQTFLGVYFQSATNGYVINASGPSNPPTVSRTTDAGSSWSAQSLPGGSAGYSTYGPAESYFLDTNDGWIALDEGTNSNSTEGILYRTTDGGATWSASTLPVPGVVRFITPSAGWLVGGSGPGSGMTGGYDSPARGFYVTHDGGITWSVATLPPPSRYGGDQEEYVVPDVDSGPASTIAATFVNTTSGYAEALVFYVTSDAGVTWSVAGTYRNPVISDDQIIPYQISSNGAWEVAPDTRGTSTATAPIVATTLNQGTAWSAETSAAPPGSVIEGLSFSDPQDGWGLANFSGCTGVKAGCFSVNQLFATSDGGKTWRAVGVTA